MRENQASREKVSYEYYITETPAYKVVEEGWELVDVLPKRPDDRYVYILVFRRQVKLK